jgi:predicted  nucleic acid-binding Zn-ribbon protein
MNFKKTQRKPNEIKKTMQDKKGEFDKDIDILKRNQIEILEMKTSVSEIKYSVESFSSRLEQI